MMEIDTPVNCIKNNIIRRIEQLQKQSNALLLKVLFADNMVEQQEYTRQFEEREAREKELKFVLKDIMFRYIND